MLHHRGRGLEVLIHNKKTVALFENTTYHATVKSECMCKEMPVIPADRVLDKKKVIGNNGGLSRRRDLRHR
jgi:hypothetical protein